MPSGYYVIQHGANSMIGSQKTKFILSSFLLAALCACSGSSGAPGPETSGNSAALSNSGEVSGSDTESSDSRFTLAVLPDTQNYLDYTKQLSEGYVIDAAGLFLDQMQYLADNSVAAGGDIAFVASVGDVWQHQSKVIDEPHVARGVVENPNIDDQSKHILRPRPETQSVELPKALQGFGLLRDVGLPFGVAPGNHDYDSIWNATNYDVQNGDGSSTNASASESSEGSSVVSGLHIGGTDNFRQVFGEDKELFSGQSWYIDAFNGGSSSAQIFNGGGYQFLHIALEMQAGDAAIEWAESVLRRNAELPTIVSTHDYLNTKGERRANPYMRLSEVDPEGNNSPQELWERLFSQHDQIFMVLSGHHHGQSYRVDANANGLPVYQILADYQDRSQVVQQAAEDLGAPTELAHTGDGWLRLMRFDLNSDAPVIRVQTYSTHYQRYSSEMSNYADWYRLREQPGMTDEEFNQADEFEIELQGFHQRFR